METRLHVGVYFTEKFIYFGPVEVYLQMFTHKLGNCRKFSRFACARAQHVISGMPVAMNTRKARYIGYFDL